MYCIHKFIYLYLYAKFLYFKNVEELQVEDEEGEEVEEEDEEEEEEEEEVHEEEEDEGDDAIIILESDDEEGVCTLAMMWNELDWIFWIL